MLTPNTTIHSLTEIFRIFAMISLYHENYVEYQASVKKCAGHPSLAQCIIGLKK